MLRHLQDKDVLFHHTEAEGEWTPLMVRLAFFQLHGHGLGWNGVAILLSSVFL
jgi:hypothetical protein